MLRTRSDSTVNLRKAAKGASFKTLSMRQWAPRLTVLAMMIVGMSMVVMARSNHPMMMTLRSTANDTVVPVLAVVSKPAAAIGEFKAWVAELAALRQENRILKAQVGQLMQWQATANELKAENEALRKLIPVIPAGKTSYVATRIVGGTGGAYMRSALISGGAADGILASQAVMAPDGLVGRVVEVGAASSRILLVTDINSRVPVIGERSRERSIASGNNSDILTLDYVETGSQLAVGERLLTSGDGGIFPAGIPVGVVAAINGSTVTVRPLADWTHLEYVSVVSHEL